MSSRKLVREIVFIAVVIWSCFTNIATQAQISGTVFRDFNFDGARTTTSGATSTAEPLVSGIIVNAYNSTNTIIASYTTTSGSGTAATYPYTGTNFSIPASGTAYNGTQGSNTGFVPSGTKVRLEFVAGTSTCSNTFDPPSHNGIANGTSVQFATAPNSTISYAINNPSDYNTGTADAFLHHPIQIKGDPLPPGSPSAAQNWFVGFPYSNTGTTPPPSTLDGSTIGSCWGVAYSKQAKKIFTSAFLKRHSGLGVLGTGGIYLLSPSGSTYNVTQFFDMDNNSFNTASNPVTRTRAGSGAPAYGDGSSYTMNIQILFPTSPGVSTTYIGATDSESGFPVGLGVVGTNTERGLTVNVNVSDYDPAAFDQVGKVGIGDIDISDDGKYLFVMNLYSRKLFRLTLNDAYNPTAVTAIDVYNLPAATAINGVIRPFGLKFWGNDVYVGAVASAENDIASTNTNLRAYVFQLTNATGSASFMSSPILDFPLDYAKGSASDGLGKKWNSWTNDVRSGEFLYYGGIIQGHVYPSPMLTDIEFD